jgi:hypothetical protein
MIDKVFDSADVESVDLPFPGYTGDIDFPQGQSETLPYPLQANTHPLGLRACFHEHGPVFATLLLHISGRAAS